MIADPIADMITRVRNANLRGMQSINTPASKFRMSVLAVLKQEGYIRDYSLLKTNTLGGEIKVELKYFDEVPVIKEIKRISKSGRRVYSNAKDLPKTYNGLGISILSTSKGVMSDADARKANIGGEILCSVF